MPDRCSPFAGRGGSVLLELLHSIGDYRWNVTLRKTVDQVGEEVDMERRSGRRGGVDAVGDCF